jgi:hypothetical protein
MARIITAEHVIPMVIGIVSAMTWMTIYTKKLNDTTINMPFHVPKEVIRRFADQITPQSWHIVLDPEDEQMQPGVLNIHLSLQGPESEVYTNFWGRKCYPHEDRSGKIWYVDDLGNAYRRNQVKPILGMIYGRMVFKDLKALGVKRKGKVAKITVRLWPYLGDWKGTLIHELAHVAVYRYQAFRTKDYHKKTILKNFWNVDLKSLLVEERLLREGHHGPSFKKAFFSLTQRVIKEFGAEIPKDDVFWQTVKYELKSLPKS